MIETNEDEKQKDAFSGFFARVLLTFALTLIAVSIAGTIIGAYFAEAAELSSLFRLGSLGLSYATVAQLFLYAVLITGLRWLIFSCPVFGGMMVLWKTALWLLGVFLTGAAFCAAFAWIPVAMWQAWIGFVLSTGICLSLCVAGMALKTKLETKKFEKLLSDYKERRRNNEN
jgi:hypothetical protein